MISKYIFPLVFIFSLSCKAQTEKEEITNAKWFYYSYAMELNGYSSSGAEIKPLSCDIKVNSIERVNGDTTKFYFSLYKKDTLNICYLKPLGLIGVVAVRNKLYTPIYHSLIFDKESDSLILERINKQSSQLLQKSLGNDKEINSWLRAEAELRKSK